VVQLLCFRYLAQMTFKGGGVFFTGLLLFGLTRRSVLAWSLLVLMETFPLLALAGLVFSNGGQTMWGNVAVMFITGLPVVAVLLSRPMRRHVGLTGRSAPSHPALG
jgi:hypothetical protein